MTFRTFTGAAPLKHVIPQLGKLRWRCLPHLHGCGPTEALGAGVNSLPMLTFRTFTGAAPLKRSHSEALRKTIRDAFRTFTGAAPLKPFHNRPIGIHSHGLPHLHGCGPTEASTKGGPVTGFNSPFRTFTGAAPLKPIARGR